MELNRSFDPNSKFPRGVHPTPVHSGSHGAPIRKDSTATRKLLSAPMFKQTNASGDDGDARQRTLAGDPLDNEQRCDHLPDPRHVRQPVQTLGS